MLLGRRTWELFAKIWPGRDTPFAQRMNAVPKLVVSRTLTDASAWANSQVAADPLDVVQREPRDVIITGSLSVVHPLIAAGLIDEYRLLTFPTILGTGDACSRRAARPHTWSCCRPSSPAPPSWRNTGRTNRGRGRGGGPRRRTPRAGR